MQLVEVPCPVCGSAAYRVAVPDTLGTKPPVFGYKWTPEVGKSYRFVRCCDCGHVYASPRLRDMYKYYVDNVDSAYLANAPLRVATARRVLEKIRQLQPGGRLIDVGCATGDFLAVAREYYDVEGLELSSWARAEAERKGLKVRAELIADMTERDAFDVATLWGVVEHLEYPLDEMQRLNRVLKPGGLICFWTGDVDNFLARWFGRRWWYVMGQHTQMFSRSSLQRLMAAAGFRLVYRGNYPYVATLGYLGSRLDRYPIVGPALKRLFNLPVLSALTFPLILPDEIFDIYRKVESVQSATPHPPAAKADLERA